jgi:long-chain acyl-CoA synthetase
VEVTGSAIAKTLHSLNVDVDLINEKNVSMVGTVLHDFLERAAKQFGDREAVWAGDQAWSFRLLDDLSHSFGQHLVAVGVRPGDRVALMLSNRPEFIVAVYGISKIGGASVLLSPSWKALEVGHAVGLTTPVHAVTDDPSTALLGDIFGESRLTDIDEWMRSDPLSRLSGDDSDVRPSDTDEAVLVFSSGTTGLPKAVRHTHRSMVCATAHWCQALGLGPTDRFQVATPPSHILGLLNLLAAADAGATVRLHRRFDLNDVLHFIEADRMTLEMAVAPIALAMANDPHLEEFDLSSLRYIMWGATPVSEAVATRVSERTGVRWLPGYGASELPVIAVNPVDRPAEWRLDSAGLPPVGVRLRVADLDSGAILPPGEIGEIQVLSPSAMAGYLPAEETADAFSDGWYRTGDVGWIEPEGWVHLTDRSKEMIKVNGFQVAPAEIEGVLHGHPAVLDCAVFGLVDESAGEVPIAVVQLDPDRPVTEDELRALVAGSLATYKQLHGVVVVDAIPRLPSGKVLRRTLRDEWTPRLLGTTKGL